MISGTLARRLTGILLFQLCVVALMQRAEAGPYAALVVEVESERVLYAQHADELRHPASLTKMMTLYMVFEALARGELSLSDAFRASRYAVSRAPSKLGLRVGELMTVEQGILALVTRSANDAATVFAEGLGGSESAFAYRMTQKARQLGMNSSIFRNASGLPDPEQWTTAWDMFRLGKSLQKHFPQYYHYFSTDHFEFGNRSFHNHNHLLRTYYGTDGIKTGFVNASGYNLVASVRRNGLRLIGVVFGGDSAARRDAHMRNILDNGFDQLEGREPTLRLAAMERPETPVLLRRPPDVEPATTRLPIGEIGFSAKRSRHARGEGDMADRSGRSREKPSWQVRVGEFSHEQSAEQRLTQAMKAAPYALRHARAAVGIHIRRGKKTYLSHFKGMSKDDAKTACRALKRKKLECVPSFSAS
jgi:D-alanyl-D-alanine carboxypeptidase